MELRDYAQVIWRRKWLIALTFVATLLAAAAILQRIPPIYTATSTLRLATGTRGSIGWDGVLYAGRLMNTYARIANSSQMQTLLRQQFPSEQSIRVDAEIIADTELIAIHVQHENPQMAQAIANSLAAMLIDESRQLDRGTQAYPLVLVDQATVPDEPSSPRTSLIMLVAALVGLMAGFGVAFLAEGFDTRLYTSAQIQRMAKLPILGSIPRIRRLHQWKPARDEVIPGQEAFRQLRTDLFAPGLTPQPRSVLVTSAEPREGKTLVAACLALSIAKSGRSVVLVDCDLRQPRLHAIFEVQNAAGLSDTLQNSLPPTGIIRPSGSPNLHLITSGPLPPNPTELLGTDRMRALIDRLLQQYDTVVLDTPAAMAVADARSVAPFVDGVLLVARRGWVHAHHVNAARERLERVGARMLGVVVNEAEPDLTSDYYPAPPDHSRLPMVEPTRRRNEMEELR